MDDRPVYVISIAAKLANMHPQTLRMYERKELLTPRRSPGRTRLYSERDIEILKEIRRLTQEMGVNLAGVEMIMGLRRQLDEVTGKIESARRERNRVQRQLEAELMRVMMRNSPQIVPTKRRTLPVRVQRA